MKETWSPEDEQGFGIRGPDKGALTPDQQRALDDLRVQTARDSQEYLHQHPEVKAMLSLLVRETLLQDRDVRTVAGELFRSEPDVVAAVRRMLGMAPKHLAARRRRSDEEDMLCTGESTIDAERGVTFTEDLPRSVYSNEGASSSPTTDEARTSPKRRDTPAPWTDEFELMSKMVNAVKSGRRLIPLEEEPSGLGNQHLTLDSPASIEWLKRELGEATGEKASPGAGPQPLSVPWMLSGKSSVQQMMSGKDPEEEEEEEAIPLARRDTPAPWSGPAADNLTLGRTEREKYVLGLLEKILEEPTDYDSVFEKLHKRTEPAK